MAPHSNSSSDSSQTTLDNLVDSQYDSVPEKVHRQVELFMDGTTNELERHQSEIDQINRDISGIDVMMRDQVMDAEELLARLAQVTEAASAQDEAVIRLRKDFKLLIRKVYESRQEMSSIQASNATALSRMRTKIQLLEHHQQRYVRKQQSEAQDLRMLVEALTSVQRSHAERLYALSAAHVQEGERVGSPDGAKLGKTGRTN
ncbi:hypothetical protein KVT40_009212 [Elsinoe batatas]|uniref:Uncharacterized protein n=1 Tax=Elsinoe batatas TaxID=2601811 RepID=A0A8K0KTA8_9PEZI|nr:hypothetical protein KVT40_009212 [Elsinoe batatas]